MPGSVVNLSVPGYRLPNPIVVDTNLIAELLIVSYLGITPISPQAIVNARRTNQFFQNLVTSNGTGIVTPTAFNEFIHVATKIKYDQEWRRMRPSIRQRYGRPIRSWLDLYKQDATILRAFHPSLQRLSELLIHSGSLVVAPDVLGPILSGRSYDEELVHLVGTYGLDSNDALILMEAQRYGVTDIITLDTDLQRARADFTIYTWL